ncbi:MAG: Rho termination factor N-terminal domain-containing protein [Nitrospirae bacterium]|nr:Rho termination factor N-terminal domain-containing protein [Nitrospirota bacterium]
MNLKDVKDMAKEKGVKAGRMKKEEIIRAIQRAEGFFDCFGSAAAGECSQAGCLWREDCLRI